MPRTSRGPKRGPVATRLLPRQSLLGDLVLVDGEDVEACANLVNALVADLNPKDFIEAGYVRSIAAHILAIARWRSMKFAVLRRRVKFDFQSSAVRKEVDEILRRALESIDDEAPWEPWLAERFPPGTPLGVLETARLKLEFEPYRLAYVDQKEQKYNEKRMRSSEPDSDQSPEVELPPNGNDELSPYLMYSAQIAFLNRQIHRAELLRDRARRDLELYRGSLSVRDGVPAAVIDAEFTEVTNDLRLQARSQSPKRAKEHGPRQPIRKAKSQPERAQTRPRGSS